MRLKLVVKGKVQGVFFRKNTQLKAEFLGLNGFVQNQSDGSVLIEIQGQIELLNQFLEWCKVGPKSAQVDEIIETHMDEVPENHFIIK